MPQTTLQINGVDNASQVIKGVTDSIGTLTTALGAAGLLTAFKNMATEAANDERNLLALQNNIKNFSNITGVTSSVIDKVNKSFQDLGLFSQDAVIEAANMATKYQAIGKDIFPQVMDAAGQLALKMGTTLAESANTLGRAMEYPERASRMLLSSGIALSQEQKEQVKQFNAIGDTASASAVILKAVTTATNSFSESMKGTGFESVTKLKTAFENLKSSIADGFLKTVQPIVDGITDLVNWFNNLDEGTKNFIITVGTAIAVAAAAAAAFQTVAVAIRAITMALAANPIGLLLIGLAAVAGAAYAFAQNLKDANKELKDMSPEQLNRSLEQAQADYKTLSGYTKIYTEDVKVLQKELAKQTELMKTGTSNERYEAELRKENIEDQIRGLDKLKKIKAAQGSASGLPKTNDVKTQAEKIKNIIEEYDMKILAQHGETDKILEKERAKALEKVKRNAEASAKIQEYYDNEVAANKVKKVQEGLGVAQAFYSAITTMVQGAYQNEIDAAEEGSEKKKKLQREAFIANKALTIGSIALSTAQAIVNALATSGPPWVGIAMAAAAGVMGAAQLAVAIGTPMPAFAKGGISSGGMALVGEQGPELVNLPRGARVNSNADSKKMLGGMSINIGTLQSNNPEHFVNGLRNIQRREFSRGVI